ncbi:hypothetical protein ACJMQP_06030 [Rhodopseudomonas palustris]
MEAINIWFSGGKLDGYCIYGVNTSWIGRLGKVIGFISALTILIDIVGERRIEVGLIDLQKKLLAVASQYFDALQIVDIAFDQRPDMDTPETRTAEKFIAVVTILLMVLLGWVFFLPSRWWGWIAYLVGIPIFSVLLGILILFLGSAAIAQAIEWSLRCLGFMRRHSVPRLVRVAALAGLVIAFFVDLFTS